VATTEHPTVEQLLARHRLKLVARPKIARHDSRDLGAAALADTAECTPQPDHRVLRRQAVIDAFPFAPALHQARAAQKLKVSGSVGDRQTGAPGKVLHATLTLAEMLEQFEAMGMAERLRNPGEAGEYVLFGAEA